MIYYMILYWTSILSLADVVTMSANNWCPCTAVDKEDSIHEVVQEKLHDLLHDPALDQDLAVPQRHEAGVLRLLLVARLSVDLSLEEKPGKKKKSNNIPRSEIERDFF